jgi:hypothetical protein
VAGSSCRKFAPKRLKGIGRNPRRHPPACIADRPAKPCPALRNRAAFVPHSETLSRLPEQPQPRSACRNRIPQGKIRARPFRPAKPGSALQYCHRTLIYFCSKISPPEAPTTAGRTPPTFVQKAFRLELDIPYRCQKS